MILNIIGRVDPDNPETDEIEMKLRDDIERYKTG